MMLSDCEFMMFIDDMMNDVCYVYKYIVIDYLIFWYNVLCDGEK